jgi:hypothetical protein
MPHNKLRKHGETVNAIVSKTINLRIRLPLLAPHFSYAELAYAGFLKILSRDSNSISAPTYNSETPSTSGGHECGYSSMVERRAVIPFMRVQFSLATPFRRCQDKHSLHDGLYSTDRVGCHEHSPSSTSLRKCRN